MTEETLKALTDRAEITDLIYRFARSIDEKDYEGIAALYAADGWFKAGRGEAVAQSDLVGHVEGKLKHYVTTQHIMSNLEIELKGTTASSRSYVQAMHVSDPETPEGHWLVGARYNIEYVRTDTGWRFQSVTLTPLWHLNNRPSWASV